MGLAEKRQKDAAMASDMKRRGEVRTTANCPVCHRLVKCNELASHLNRACGRDAAKVQRQ